MDNFLVPFKFQVFQTNEAVWDMSSKTEYIRMFRMTRRGIGEFLNPDSKNPQKIVDKIIERNPHLRELSIPVTVTGMTGQKYEADTYDIWGIFQICVESSLARAKEFLRRFPKFLEALYTRSIKPPAIGKIKPEVLGYMGIPHKEKKAYMENILSELGWSRGKFFMECNRAEDILNVKILNQREPRSDKGRTSYPDEKQKVLEFVREHPEYLKGGKNRFSEFSKRKIKSILGLAVPDSTTVSRWVREYQGIKCATVH